MNILFFLTPKVNVGFVYSSDTVSEAAEKMLKYRFTTVPVINEVTGRYEGTLANDDLLRELYNNPSLTPAEAGSKLLKSVTRRRDYGAVKADADIEDLLNAGVACCSDTAEKSQFCKDRGRGADRGDQFPFPVETDHLLHQRRACPEVGSPRNSSGKDEHIIFIPVQVIRRGVGDDGHIVRCNDYGCAVHGNLRAGNTCAEKHVGNGQSFDRLESIGEKEGRFVFRYSIGHDDCLLKFNI